jgi:pimeloyl-ACP methyl ester carboxylesterase
MTDVQEPVTDVQDKTESPQEQADEALRRFADGFSWLRRAPVLHSPAEHGLDYEDVTFPARDGVPLEGWFIPAPGSGKLIIANHPMGFSRSGMPTQHEPWHADWAASGNGFEVDLVPDYKILHDAGYNVLAYDLRNHGLSSAANGGVSTHGITEWRDIAGSLTYARTRPGAGDMIIGLFSRCMGAVATFAAMTRCPAAFDGVRCLVSPQPVTPRVIVERRLAVMGLGDRLEDFNTLVRLRTSVGLEQRVPQEWARNVRVPTFLYQVRGDILTRPSDVQAMFDNIPVAEKKLQWIEGTTARWDGYLEFQRRPQPMLDWFAQYMS